MRRRTAAKPTAIAVSPDGLTGYAAVGGGTPALKTIDIAKGVAIHSAPLAETPSTTALLWLNQVFVALPAHAYLDTYDAPFTPQPENSWDGTVGHGVVGWTDEVQTKPSHRASHCRKHRQDQGRIVQQYPDPPRDRHTRQSTCLRVTTTTVSAAMTTVHPSA